MHRVVLGLLVTAGQLGAAAQNARSVALVVTDTEGVFVPDIRAEEVRILENGEPRELVAFERDARPLAVALVIDTSTGAARTSAGSLMGLDTLRDSLNLSIVGAGDHERILSGLAQGSGGRFESVPAVLGVGRILETLAAELGGQYRLRYAATEAKGARRIEVRLARSGLRWRVAIDTP